MTVGNETTGIFVCLAKHPNNLTSGMSVYYSLGKKYYPKRHSWIAVGESTDGPSASDLISAFMTLDEHIHLNEKWLEVDPDLTEAAIEYRLFRTLKAM